MAVDAAWRKSLRDASFRGAAFYVESHDHEFGRRQELHEYPLQPVPWAEDLGRAARRYSVEGFVIGEDYMPARDALVAAVEAEGPGTLVDPYLGALNVVCVRARLRESAREGGMAVFSLEFVEAGELAQPADTTDTAASSKDAADASAAQAQAGFGAAFDTAGAPAHVEKSAAGLLGKAMDAVKAAADKLTGLGDKLAAFQQEAAAIRSGIIGLVRAPLTLAARVLGVVHSIRDLAETPADALSALSPLLDFGSDLAAVLGDTPGRRRERANQDQLVRLVRHAAAGEIVAAVAEMAFDSYQAATGLRDDLAERLDGLALDVADAGDDAAYAAIGALRLAMIRDVTARGGSLVRLFTYTPLVTQPALVIAHRLYGDATRADEIVARNRIRHPGFVPGGVGLEVLTPDG